MDNPQYYSNKGLYTRLFIRCILAALIMVFIIFIFPKALRLLFPFVLALIVAVALNPVVNTINRKLGISRRIIALVLDLLVFMLVATLIGTLAYSVVNEAVALANNVQMNWDNIVGTIDGIGDSFNWLINYLPPQIMDVLANFEDSIISFLQNSSKTLLSSVISATTSVTTKTGNFFVNFIMAILAAYFLISDYNRIGTAAKKFIGERTGKYLSILKNSALTALGGYVRSQLLLATFAFIFMFIALLIIGQPYALLIALLLGFIDLLPIVGTIAVLVPWGIFELITGDINTGIYLLAVGIVFFLIRKVIEPKIVGSQTGLHPLAALISTFIGLQFSGVWGAILGPVVLMVVISVYKTGIFDSTIADVKAVINHISLILQGSEAEV
ncbi:sporulation integral membrane protein YtvI [Tyzzerella sp. OttesenSCG-928-J15]|nr:sporulation integral membrane protein YtvI [Tyzzerella sp. OttesenSCG-928-J15]